MSDADERAWLEAVAKLPEDRREAVAQWFAVQKITAEALGLDAMRWWSLVETAMQNPFAEPQPTERTGRDAFDAFLGSRRR